MIVRNGRFAYTKTPAEVRVDFEKFRAMDVGHMVDGEAPWFTRSGAPAPSPLWVYRRLTTGQRLSEYHNWRHRVRTPNAHHPSGQQVLDRWRRDPDSMAHCFARSCEHNRGSSAESNAWETVRMNSALHTTGHFRASVSRHLCEATGAERVLDFSCGWCDRLTGFLASPGVVHIEVIDPRRGSVEAARKQHAFVGSRARLVAHQGAAEEVMPTLPSSSFDLIVTSPPFFTLERYGEDEGDTKGQIWTKARDNAAFVRVFLEPVIAESARLLRPGGTLALNVDDNPKEGVEMCRPTLRAAKRAGLRLVGTAGMIKASGLWTGGSGVKADPIYIFRRPSK